jgi:predicted PhzF superfamily epimerase YddE/YHI9
MAELHVLRVFIDDAGEHGNPLGVFIEGASIPVKARQRVARELGFSETVFVDESTSGTIRIFTPTVELGFAGHPTVGTAWLLTHLGAPVESLRPPAGVVTVRTEGDLTFIAARPEWVDPPFNWVRAADPAEVEALTGPPAGMPHVGVWAWEDEAAGRLRSRVFPDDIGIGEDEATGAAAIQMAAALGRELHIRQGRGSRLIARPLADGRAEVGGRVKMVERRQLEV